MSVFTSVDQNQLDHFLSLYDLGKAISLDGITNGITNSNYRLETENGQYILTLFEVTGTEELIFALNLQLYLRNNGVSVAAPVKDRQGRVFSTLHNRSAAIIEFLDGDYELNPALSQVDRIAIELARFHQVTLNYRDNCSNIRGIDWCLDMQQKLAPQLSTDDQKFLTRGIENYALLSTQDLPRCAIHADLFRDNVLFAGDQLSGIIDFDYACTDFAILDIAITVNDWCLNQQRQIDTGKLGRFVNAYQSIRPLSAIEKASLAVSMQFAAIRFWLSRLYDLHFPLAGSLTFSKDPEEFRQLLISLQHLQIDLF